MCPLTCLVQVKILLLHEHVELENLEWLQYWKYTELITGFKEFLKQV